MAVFGHMYVVRLLLPINDARKQHNTGPWCFSSTSVLCGQFPLFACYCTALLAHVPFLSSIHAAELSRSHPCTGIRVFSFSFLCFAPTSSRLSGCFLFYFFAPYASCDLTLYALSATTGPVFVALSASFSANKLTFRMNDTTISIEFLFVEFCENLIHALL